MRIAALKRTRKRRFFEFLFAESLAFEQISLSEIRVILLSGIALTLN